MIDRLEAAQGQTWWLPTSAQLFEGPDYCFYENGGQFNIVRFTPDIADVQARLQEICARIGQAPAIFNVFPHRHGSEVFQALASAGFSPGHRYEARAIHVEAYDRLPPDDMRVVAVETVDDMRQVYAIRAEVFGGRPPETENTLRRYLKDATGPDARVRQFLVFDRDTDRPLCQAGMSLFPSLNVAFLFAGGTLETARGRGAYTALVAARIECARSVGIEYVALFAREDTSAPIVNRQGFEYYGDMQAWTLNRR